MAFQQGLSGLNSASRNLDVIGHNIANANTVGMKSSRAEFAELYASSINASGGVAYLKYARWYSNAQGGAPNADVFTVQISNDNGATWTNVEVVGPAGAEANGGWNFKTFKISDIIPATATTPQAIDLIHISIWHRPCT